MGKSLRIPKDKQGIYNKITALTDAVCSEHLNEEYAELASQLTATLCRKRPSPLESGRPNSWACGIVYALGTVNFLFDKSNEPYMSATDLCRAFDVSPSTGAAKASSIRKMLKMMQLDPNWCLPSRMESNPLVWMLSVNGFIVDIRTMPREVQQIAFEKGLIPYIPEDQDS